VKGETMTQYQLEEVVVMKPVKTGALFSIGAFVGPILVLAAGYYALKLFREFRENMSNRFSAEEAPVSNIIQNAGVSEVVEQYSTLAGQAVGQTRNDYMRAYPVSSFGQNFGGRSF